MSERKSNGFPAGVCPGDGDSTEGAAAGICGLFPFGVASGGGTRGAGSTGTKSLDGTAGAAIGNGADGIDFVGGRWSPGVSSIAPVASTGLVDQ
jgi:hypothetical protein